MKSHKIVTRSQERGTNDNQGPQTRPFVVRIPPTWPRDGAHLSRLFERQWVWVSPDIQDKLSWY